MQRALPEPDSREPRGIIIQTGTPRRTRTPFWAYLWSEEAGAGACAPASGGRILESAPPADGLIRSCRASP